MSSFSPSIPITLLYSFQSVLITNVPSRNDLIFVRTNYGETVIEPLKGCSPRAYRNLGPILADDAPEPSNLSKPNSPDVESPIIIFLYGNSLIHLYDNDPGLEIDCLIDE